MTMSFLYIFLDYICPSLGCIMSALMYAAPVNELRTALVHGRLGSLNPVPWAIMTGNCIGWSAYAYYAWDPFILASNIPGLVLSIWLNMGAAKLQYLQSTQQQQQQQQQHNQSKSSFMPLGQQQRNDDNNNNNDDDNNVNYLYDSNLIIFVPQETLLLRVVIVWMTILVGIGWLHLVGNSMETQQSVLGILVNINLIFFYGAPLQTLHTVIATKSSSSIHKPTMIMNWFNTSFWIFYGLFAKHDPIIYVPNSIGLFLGILQGVVCIMYPTTTISDEDDINHNNDGILRRRLPNRLMNFRHQNQTSNADLMDPLLLTTTADTNATTRMDFIPPEDVEFPGELL